MVDSEEMGVPCDQEPCGGFLELNWPQGWFPVETLAWQRDRREEQVGCSGDGSCARTQYGSREAWLGDLEFTDNQKWTRTQVSGLQLAPYF